MVLSRSELGFPKCLLLVMCSRIPLAKALLGWCCSNFLKKYKIYKSVYSHHVGQMRCTVCIILRLRIYMTPQFKCLEKGCIWYDKKHKRDIWWAFLFIFESVKCFSTSASCKIQKVLIFSTKWLFFNPVNQPKSPSHHTYTLRTTSLQSCCWVLKWN